MAKSRFREQKRGGQKRLLRAFSNDVNGGSGFRGGSAASSVREVRGGPNRMRFGIRLVSLL